MNNELNEKLLLVLLDQTNVAYHQKDQYDNYMYFYPKELGLTVQIKCHECQSLSVNFVKESRYNEEQNEVINFSLPHYSQASTFLSKLYDKFEFMLNSKQDTNINKRFDEILSKPLEKLPHYTIEGENNSLTVVLRENNTEIRFNIGRAFLSYSNKKITYNTLEPIKLEIFWKEKSDTSSNFITKIIPAYEIDKYPLLSKYASVTPSHSDAYDLLESLSKKVDKKGASLLHNLILDMELPKKETSTHKTNKI